MELEFEPVDNKQFKVIAVQNGIRKQVGFVYTPSSSGWNIKNAIQVCGFSEAFDLWGCAVFGQKSDKEKVVARLERRPSEWKQVKDIQLLFEWDTEPHRTEHGGFGPDGCLGCYNSPCTCDNERLVLTMDEVDEGKGKTGKNPYKVKREEELEVERVKKDEGTINKG